MEATKLRDADLIAQYKRESVERRAARKLTGTSKLANTPTEQDEQSTAKKGKQGFDFVSGWTRYRGHQQRNSFTCYSGQIQNIWTFGDFIS